MNLLTYRLTILLVPVLVQGDAYGDRRQRKKRSEPLRAAQEAYAAVMAAASMAVPELLRCELCQVSSSCSSSKLAIHRNVFMYIVAFSTRAMF